MGGTISIKDKGTADAAIKDFESQKAVITTLGTDIKTEIDEIGPLLNVTVDGETAGAPDTSSVGTRLKAEADSASESLRALAAGWAGWISRLDVIDQHGKKVVENAGGDKPAKEKSRFEYTDKDLYPRDPSAEDVKQTDIGDCYLVATMGAVAKANPQWIKDRIRYDDKTGKFDVTLWDGKEWKHIPVTQEDIKTNINKRGASRRDDGESDGALWPSVLESAYATLKNPNKSHADALGKSGIGNGGQESDALWAITGNQGTNIDPRNVWFTDKQLDQRIATALAAHQPVTVSTTSGGPGLVNTHVYIVERISGTGGDAQVTLRNPWQHNFDTPSNTASPTITARLGDLIGSGLPGNVFGNGPLGTHPLQNVNIGLIGSPETETPRAADPGIKAPPAFTMK